MIGKIVRPVLTVLLLAAALCSQERPYRSSPGGPAIARTILCAREVFGDWLPADPANNGISKLGIALRDPAHVEIHAYGKCSPADCDWTPSLAQCTPNGEIRWVHRDNAATRTSSLRLENGRLLMDMTSQYFDGRPARSTQESFVHPGSRGIRVSDLSRYRGVIPNPGAAPPPSPAPLARGLEPDGTVVVTLPDGSVKRILPDGSMEIRSPNGTVVRHPVYSVFASVRENLPPAPPDSSLGFWLTKRNAEVLHVIQGIVRNDDAVQRYVDSEQGFTEYDIFKGRIALLNRLVSQ